MFKVSSAERKKMFEIALSQPVITCTKLKIETLEQGVKYVQGRKCLQP